MIPDPDCESFCGLYAGGPSEILPPSEYDLGKLAKYLKARKIKYTQLTSEELEKFKRKINLRGRKNGKIRFAFGV